MEKILHKQIDQQLIYGGVILAARLDGSKKFCCEAGFTAADSIYRFTAETIVDVASVTKAAAVITALLICIEKKLISPDRCFADYLPQLRYRLNAPVSVADLANHTSGFGNIAGMDVYPYFAESGQEMFNNVLAMPPVNPPGGFEYACWNYLLLSMLIEEVTQKKITDFCRQEIFEPLDMTQSSLGSPVTADLSQLAHTIGTPKPGMISDGVARRLYRDGYTAGNAGMFSNAADLAKLLRCYLREGVTDQGGRLFSREVFDLLLPSDRRPNVSERMLGWIVGDEVFPELISGRTLMHSGWSGQTVWMDTAKKHLVIVLTARCGDYDLAKQSRLQLIRYASELLNS